MLEKIKNNDKKIINKFLLLGFIILTVFVKFYKIDARSFSFDELYSVVGALEPNYNDFLENWVLYDSNPPLYYFVLRLWLKIVPATEFWVRLLSVFFVLLASFLFVKGIKKRFQNNTWFYLLILISTSYSFLFFAQEARAYALLLLFTCLQILYFIDVLSYEKQKKFLQSLLFFTICSIVSSYTHYTGIIFSGILFLGLIYNYFGNFKVFRFIILSVLLCIISGLPWLNYFLFILDLDKSFIINQDISIIKEIISMLFFGHSVIGKYLTILFIIIFIFLFVFSVKNRFNEIRNRNMMILSVGLVSILVILFSPFIKFIFQYKHYIVFIPILLLSISIFLASFDSIKKRNILIISTFLVVIAQGFTHYKNTREEWRQVVKYIVEKNNNDNAKVIILGEPWELSHKEYLKIDPGYLNVSIRRKKMYNYYFKRFDKENKIELLVLRPNKKVVENFIQNELKSNNKIFILSHAGEFEEKIKKIELKENVILQEKDFYMHIAYYLTK